MGRRATAIVILLVVSGACSPLELDPPAPYAYAVYDPGSGRLPTPNQALVDEDEGHIDLSTDGDDLTAPERAMREWLNTLDGWSTTATAKLEFSEPIDPTTVTADSFAVWEWGASPILLEDTTVELSEDGLTLTAAPSRHGWKRGATYVVIARGGEAGLRSAAGADVGPDAAFWYLRLDQRLDTHPRAFTGSTRAERQDTADRMEALRQSIAPYITFFEDAGIPRDDLIALWEFRTTTRVELAMDRESQRVPMPFDLLIDPDTGLVDLSAADWDSELEADAKVQANKLDGFGLSANPFFQLTGAIDPATATPDTIRLYDVSQTAVQLETDILVMTDEGAEPCEGTPVDEGCRHVFLRLAPDTLPLTGSTTYAVVVTEGLLDLEGRPVVPMSIGRFMMLSTPIAVDGASQIGSIEDDSAARLEGVRLEVEGLLDQLGRDGMVTAWPFTTMDALPELRAVVDLGQEVGAHPTPTIDSRMPAWTLIGLDMALADLFPGLGNPGPDLYAARTAGIAEVVQGTIPMPYFLEPDTRRWREDGGFETVDVHYMATIPEDPPPGDLKVVIFGHAVVTDRRFLLAVGGRLAQEGFAAVAIDFPFHGERLACVDASLVATPNFLPPDLQTLTGLTDNLLYFPPCVSGSDATCSPTGQCLDIDGNVEDFTKFPILDLAPVGGAAFLDVSDIAHITDHFEQAVVDLGTLRYSLQTEPSWEGVFGREIERESFGYAGQSLGAIIGATYVALDPTIDRAVLNVAGSNMVDLFVDSTFFGPQIDAVMEDLDVVPGSYEAERLLQFSSWLIDSVDPHTVGHLYALEDRDAIIQMDKVGEGVGDLVIPNHTTESLARVSGLPLLEYPSILHGDLVIPVIGDAMLADLANYLSGDLEP